MSDRLIHHFSAGVQRCCVVGVMFAISTSLSMGTTPVEIQDGTAKEVPSKKTELSYRTEKIRGQIVWLSDALKRAFGITTVAEVAEHVLAIQTADGTLVPIVENVRGRAFRKDARLREMELELAVRVFEKQPFVQIVGTYEVKGEQRLEIDYWCDVCAIVMYEAGKCSCCQDDNRLRKRRVENGETLSEEVDVKK